MRPGDGNSFDAVALPHLDAVYRVARRLAGDEERAQDLVQETFLKAHQAFGRFEMREFGIRPWLLKILHNTFFNRQARERRAPKSAEGRVLESIADSSSGGHWSRRPSWTTSTSTAR